MCSCNKNLKNNVVYTVNTEDIVTKTQINAYISYLECAVNKRLDALLGIPINTLLDYLSDLKSYEVFYAGKQPKLETTQALKVIIPVLIQYDCP